MIQVKLFKQDKNVHDKGYIICCTILNCKIALLIFDCNSEFNKNLLKRKSTQSKAGRENEKKADRIVLVRSPRVRVLWRHSWTDFPQSESVSQHKPQRLDDGYLTVYGTRDTCKQKTCSLHENFAYAHASGCLILFYRLSFEYTGVVFEYSKNVLLTM